MWGISAGVCGIRNDVYVQVCGLCLDVCFFLFLCDGSGLHDPDCDWNRDSAAHLAKSARGLTCHCEWKPNILQPIHFGCLRERERRWDRRGGERERESWSVHLSLHPSVCLSLWTALSPSSQIRLLIVWAFLDRFASNSRSCTGNVDETNKSQKEGLMRNVIFLVFGGVEEPSDDHSDMKRWLQAGETLENKTINQNVRRKIIVFEQ